MKNKPEITRSYLIAVRYASAAGSTATTSRGIIRAALKHRKASRVAPASVLDIMPRIIRKKSYWSARQLSISGYTTPIKTQILQSGWTGKRTIKITSESRDLIRHRCKIFSTTPGCWIPRARRWNAEQRADLRAKADPKYRASFVRRLRKIIAESITLPAPTLEAVTYWKNHLTDREISHTKSRARILACSPKANIPIFPKTLPFAAAISIDESTARKCGAKLDMRGKDSEVRSTMGSSHLDYTPPETEWKNGKPISYTRAERINYVRSMGVITAAGARLDCVFAAVHHSFDAPEGHRWERDSNGIALVRIADRCEYHPDADDLTRNAFHLPAIIQDNENRRQAEITRAKAEKAEVEGVWVCLADSLRAGNCRAGSLQWADSHRVNPTTHHRATELLPMAVNGSAQRVRIAISCAARRHREEMQKGFCLLSNHCA